MDFEYDPDKSGANRQKHGIDFEQAQALGDDPHRVQIPAEVTDQPRFLVIEMIGDKRALRLIRSARQHRDMLPCLEQVTV